MIRAKFKIAKKCLVRTTKGIIEMPVEVLGTRPALMPPALWTRCEDLCKEWTGGRPEKPITDLLIPDSIFRAMRDRVEEFLYKIDHSLVDETAENAASPAQATIPVVDRPVIESLKRINWKKLSEFGFLNENEPEGLIDMAHSHQEDLFVKLRKLVEQMVKQACKKAGLDGKGSLFEMIGALEKQGLVDKPVEIALAAIRKSGNVGAHETLEKGALEPLVHADVLHFIQITEWFLKLHAAG